MRQFSSDVKIVPILSPLAAEAATDRVSNVIDMEGYDSVCIAVHFGTIDDAGGGAYSLFLQHADAASDGTTLTSGADIAGSLQTVTGTSDDDVFYYDINDVTEKFLQLNVDKDTTNNTNESAIAYLYRSKSSAPVTHADSSGTSGGSGAVTGEKSSHPVDGTK